MLYLGGRHKLSFSGKTAEAASCRSLTMRISKSPPMTHVVLLPIMRFAKLASISKATKRPNLGGTTRETFTSIPGFYFGRFRSFDSTAMGAHAQTRLRSKCRPSPKQIKPASEYDAGSKRPEIAVIANAPVWRRRRSINGWFCAIALTVVGNPAVARGTALNAARSLTPK